MAQCVRFVRNPLVRIELRHQTTSIFTRAVSSVSSATRNCWARSRSVMLETVLVVESVRMETIHCFVFCFIVFSLSRLFDSMRSMQSRAHRRSVMIEQWNNVSVLCCVLSIVYWLAVLRITWIALRRNNVQVNIYIYILLMFHMKRTH